jgi:hypothetical protein
MGEEEPHVSGPQSSDTGTGVCVAISVSGQSDSHPMRSSYENVPQNAHYIPVPQKYVVSIFNFILIFMC